MKEIRATLRHFKIFISNIHQSATKNYKSLQSICTQTKKQILKCLNVAQISFILSIIVYQEVSWKYIHIFCTLEKLKKKFSHRCPY